MKLPETLRTIFTTPTAPALAQRELEEAQRELLKAQAGAEYASRMVQYHSDRIKRLTGFLAASAKEAAQ